jgi:hypothetical protein
MASRALLLCACAVFAACGSALAQTAVPLIEPNPVFTPGLYETESRNSAFQNQVVKSRTCITSAGYDAFRDETMAQSRSADERRPRYICARGTASARHPGRCFRVAPATPDVAAHAEPLDTPSCMRRSSGLRLLGVPEPGGEEPDLHYVSRL